MRYDIGGSVSSGTRSFKITVNTSYKPIVKVKAADGKVTLKWKKVDNADKYTVYRIVNGKLKKAMTTEKTAVKIKQKDTDTGYAVKAHVKGKTTSIGKNDIVNAPADN